MKKIGILIIMILCLTSAFAFQARVEAINNQILPGETAVYLLTVENDGSTDDDLKVVFNSDPRWSIITKPIYHQTSFKIRPGQQIVTTISLTPDESVDYGQQYEYTFGVQSNLDNFQRFLTVQLFLRSPDRITDYVPIVEMDVDVDSEIDPRDEGQLSVNLKNFNRLNITELIINVESEIEPKLNQELTTTLAGLEEKKLVARFKYNALEKPATDTFTVRGYIPSRNKTLDSKTKKINILAYNDMVKNQDIVESFLKKQTTYSYYNDGNVNTTVDLAIQTSLFGQIFTRAEPKPAVIKVGGYRQMVWSLYMDAQARDQIVITANYRPLFIFIVIIILVVVLYYALRAPIIIRKQAINETNKGDTSRLKVLLHIKNRTGRIVDNVAVSDRIPRIADLDPNYPIGTMQPSKVIKHDKRGTIVKWVVPTLEAYEERIITYHINSRLRIVGSMRLPNSMVKYKNKMGRVSKVYSAKVSAE